MKRILHLALICAGIGIFAASTSCSSEYDATPQVPGRDTIKNPLRGDFTAMVDGLTFVANSKYVSDQTINGIRVLTITGVMDSPNKDPETNQTISLSITNYNGVGSYPIQLGTAGIYTVRKDGDPTVFQAKSGDSTAMITITSDQGNVTGNFSFVVAPNGMGTANNHVIAGGTFDIPK